MQKERLIIDLVSASVTGMEHVQPDMPLQRNNQDAVAIRYAPGKGAVAIVCDGCGSKGSSELGAHFGARYLARHLFDWHIDAPSLHAAEVDWDFAANDLTHFLRQQATMMGTDWRTITMESFLFTIVGFMITPVTTYVFHFGDGVEMVNDEITVLGPFLKDPPPELVNAPPYVMYREIGSPLFALDPSLRHFHVRSFPTRQIRNVGVGCDGLADLMKLEATPFPGTNTPIGPLGQVFDDRFFANPDALRRHFAKANRITVQDGRIKRGLLPDDTSAALARIRWETEDASDRSQALDEGTGI